MTTVKDMIRNTLEMSDFMMKAYLGDLSDADLLVVPVPGMNTAAWQIGHLIAVENSWADMIQPGASPALPEGFADAHNKETAAPKPFKGAYSKADYLSLWDNQRAATLKLLDGLSDDRLDADSGLEYAPTFAKLLNIIGVHALGHAGQLVALRRALGKPVVV